MVGSVPVVKSAGSLLIERLALSPAYSAREVIDGQFCGGAKV